MNNQEKKQEYSAYPIISLLLCVFFACIVFLSLFFVYSKNNYDAYVPALIFSGINCFVLTIVITLKEYIKHLVADATYIQAVFVSVIFTILQFGFLIFALPRLSCIFFTLIDLAILFVYLLVIIPTILAGTKNNN